MSNMEKAPSEVLLASRDETDGTNGSDPAHPAAAGGPDVGPELIEARDVPLGGPRAMTGRRTLPSKARSFVGAWCFVDHYGPDRVAATGGMDVPPHPHTGLQTVSWLFRGEIEHRDSHGVHAIVRPGELNLMSAGWGIAHSEVSTPTTDVLHGVQLWLVLPRGARGGPREFQHHAPTPTPLPDDAGTALVFIGSLLGVTSPVRTATPLLGAEIALEPGAVVDLAVQTGFEHGVLVDSGRVEVDDEAVPVAQLAFRGPADRPLRLANVGETPARLVLLGGEPFTEEIVMWWNFIGGSHAEVVRAREEWNASGVPDRELVGGERFGAVAGYRGERAWLPAPDLPQVRLRPRRNPNVPR
jgi:redox-sensitive bicupin YhaK (pirin superfamily)